ncbi:hypothetical protein D9611_002880 [Ephemerocybe angulata]|uniref:HMG box domain-containing protein n=1 Tax=Ephemerocybe angulata TaxID=980116 RepID=A0A8H5C9D2_9AGAR|nr:hypothetical protein D9611_002880 [Tulosesus angulatus]
MYWPAPQYMSNLGSQLGATSHLYEDGTVLQSPGFELEDEALSSRSNKRRACSSDIEFDRRHPARRMGSYPSAFGPTNFVPQFGYAGPPEPESSAFTTASASSSTPHDNILSAAGSFLNSPASNYCGDSPTPEKKPKATKKGLKNVDSLQVSKLKAELIQALTAKTDDELLNLFSGPKECWLPTYPPLPELEDSQTLYPETIKAKRPANCFILFQSYVSLLRRAPYVGLDFGKLSLYQAAGVIWGFLHEHHPVKIFWENAFETCKKHHEASYKGYKFIPIHASTRKAARAARRWLSPAQLKPLEDYRKTVKEAEKAGRERKMRALEDHWQNRCKGRTAGSGETSRPSDQSAQDFEASDPSSKFVETTGPSFPVVPDSEPLETDPSIDGGFDLSDYVNELEDDAVPDISIKTPQLNVPSTMQQSTLECASPYF